VTAKSEIPQEPILRDHLALDRTKLANERTLLAYLRTALVLILSGITIIKLFQIEDGARNEGMIVLACVLLVVGIITGTFGGVHCYKTSRRMKEWERQLDAAQALSPKTS
jgi:putative membrane protein